MNIIGTYDNTTGLVRVLYDSKAQRAFRRSSAQVASVRKNPLVRRLLAERSEDVQERLAAGAAFLQLLGESLVRDVTIHDHQLQAAFVQLMMGASFVAASRRSLGAMPEALLLLAEVTPYRIAPLLLPPAAEVFSENEVSNEVWASYEAIRCCKPPDKVLVPVLRLHALAQTLIPMTDNDQLRLLGDQLEKLTRMFHNTMGALAARTVIDAQAEAPRKRRNS